jgi:hypothetical protein
MNEDAEIHAVNRCVSVGDVDLASKVCGLSAAKCWSLTASRDRFRQLMTSSFDVIVVSTLPIAFRPGNRPGGFVGLGSFHRRHRSNPAVLELTLDCCGSRVCGCGTSRPRPGVLPVTEFRRFVPE